MTVRFSITLLFRIISCILILAGYLGGMSYSNLVPRTFFLKAASGESEQKSSGLTINLPPVVAPVDDGERDYYVQVNLALDLDRSGTAGLIQARHDVIDRQIMEVLHSYSVNDLRSTAQLSALRTDVRRAINKLLPRDEVRNVYITNWLMPPVGY